MCKEDYVKKYLEQLEDSKLEEIADEQDNYIEELEDYIMFLENYNQDLEDRIIKMAMSQVKENKTVCKVPGVRQISYCDEPGKEKVVVVFTDNTKIIKEMCQGDNFDLNVGVALCIMEKIYGSKSQYHKFVDNSLVARQKGNK